MNVYFGKDNTEVKFINNPKFEGREPLDLEKLLEEALEQPILITAYSPDGKKLGEVVTNRKDLYTKDTVFPPLEEDVFLKIDEKFLLEIQFKES